MKYAAILFLTVISLLYTFQNTKNQHRILSEYQPTIFDWQYCIERIMLKTCDQDDPQDRQYCYSAASKTSQCYSETSQQASTSCVHWWIYFESSQGKDTLPDSFYQCAEDCTQYAKENSFYFSQTFQPMWITCSQQQRKEN
ncbi:hypothetical protein TTHERM_00434100 (macronuclear) [Tetrahymena thermophila SB210]|uniref:Transmembrane protein n=1 Tax=Tetrahymena thermophila (strain SB210) TaxID=312017 RepID=Q230U9_TETTS|nr:hypothetical protein TTHERM_00434100 [Tetrahymena thermophila SB210]EAR91190.2 hypothetical protein TTHERM_00434100 [Tetrahymena thermophila SB210]|eukprot:XP_001011435.2 hypothetical protein TTHERM_00434100 [Tetrahymena thermophila SB210]